MSTTLPLSGEPFQAVLTYVFKEGSPKIQVLLNFLKDKNKFALVNVSTDKNGYTTVTTTNTASADSCGGCDCCACTCCDGDCL